MNEVALQTYKNHWTQQKKRKKEKWPYWFMVSEEIHKLLYCCWDAYTAALKDSLTVFSKVEQGSPEDPTEHI